MLQMHVCCRLSFPVLSQKTGWKERLQNDLFCAKWDAKPQLNNSIKDRFICSVFTFNGRP